jgi:type IV pilus assembly protein PilO
VIEQFFSRITQTQALLVGLILAGFYFFTVYDDGSSQIAQREQAISETSRIDTEINTMRQAIEQAKAYEQLADQKGQKFTEWIKFLPRDFDRKDQMRLISRAATSAAMELNLSEGMGNQARKFEFYEELEVDSTLRGTFSELMVFLADLTKSNRVIGVRSLNIVSDSSRDMVDGTQTRSPNLSIQIKFIGYKYTAPEGTP